MAWRIKTITERNPDAFDTKVNNFCEDIVVIKIDFNFPQPYFVDFVAIITYEDL